MRCPRPNISRDEGYMLTSVSSGRTSSSSKFEATTVVVSSGDMISLEDGVGAVSSHVTDVA